jgi:hypothetical protein
MTLIDDHSLLQQEAKMLSLSCEQSRYGDDYYYGAHMIFGVIAKDLWATNTWQLLQSMDVITISSMTMFLLHRYTIRLMFTSQSPIDSVSFI